MTYKEQEHQKLAIKLHDRINSWPVFLKEYFITIRGEKTKYINYTYIRLFFNWILDNNIIQKDSIDKIIPADISCLTSMIIIKYFTCLKRGIGCAINSDSTITTKLNMFHALWDYFIENQYAQENVITKEIKRQFKDEECDKNVSKRGKVPTNNDLMMFINNLKNINNEFESERNSAIVQLFKGSGIRLSELIGLDVDDVCIDDYYIMVMRKGNTKKKSKVYISESARDALKLYLEYREQIDGLYDNALFVSDRLKKRLTTEAITYIFKKYSNGSITPHMIRHYVGTKIYNETKNAKITQLQLGHSDAKTTMGYYVHGDEDVLMANVRHL